MSNNIALATLFQQELDKQMITQATSGWMEANAGQVKYSGGATVKIPKIDMDGLGNYSRSNGYVSGSVTLAFETFTLSQDRARQFSIDAMDVDESNFTATAGNVMGEFQRTKVIPEVDAYRYASLATKALAGTSGVNYVSGYTLATADIYTQLKADIAAVQDQIGDTEPLIVSISHAAAAVLETTSQIYREIELIDFQKGDITTKVKSIDGVPLIRVPSARMKTAITLYDGTTSGQTAGGFATASGAKQIHWLITATRSPLAISKTDTMRIFDPLTNQSANAWKIDYRKYHDIWVPDNKVAGVFVRTA